MVLEKLFKCALVLIQHKIMQKQVEAPTKTSSHDHMPPIY